MSVSPVTRAATKPITTARGKAAMDAHAGMENMWLIRKTMIGANKTKPEGNHQPGHSTRATGSSSTFCFLPKSFKSPEKDRKTLRPSSRKLVTPAETRIAAPGHKVHCT